MSNSTKSARSNRRQQKAPVIGYCAKHNVYGICYGQH